MHPTKLCGLLFRGTQFSGDALDGSSGAEGSFYNFQKIRWVSMLLTS